MTRSSLANCDLSAKIIICIIIGKKCLSNAANLIFNSYCLHIKYENTDVLIMHTAKKFYQVLIFIIYLDIDPRTRMDDLNFLVEFFQDYMEIVNIIARIIIEFSFGILF